MTTWRVSITSKIINVTQQYQNARGRGCGYGGSRGQGWRNKEHSNKSHIQYFNCNNYWHYSIECYYKAPSKEKVNHVEKTEAKPTKTVLMVCNVDEGQDYIWYLDTGSRICAIIKKCSLKFIILSILL